MALDYAVGTNPTYRQPELLTRDWRRVLTRIVPGHAAYFVAALNHDMSVCTHPIKQTSRLPLAKAQSSERMHKGAVPRGSTALFSAVQHSAAAGGCRRSQRFLVGLRPSRYASPPGIQDDGQGHIQHGSWRRTVFTTEVVARRYPLQRLDTLAISVPAPPSG